MIYRITSQLTLQSDDRQDVLLKILLMQRHAVKIGFDPANIVIVQLTESTELPVTDITSEVIGILLAGTMNPPPTPPDPPPPPPPTDPVDPPPPPVT